MVQPNKKMKINILKIFIEAHEGGGVYLWLIHVDVWQKPTQYCKAIIFQLKNTSKKFIEDSDSDK